MPNKNHRINIANQVNLISGTDVPLPSMVEISNSGTCNRSCSFCPRSDPTYPNIPEFITTTLIIKLGKQLAEQRYSGLILFAGFCEPLLDKRLNLHIAILRSLLPNSIIEVVTNGDVLTTERISSLFRAGLSRLLISAYDGIEQVNHFQEICNAANTGGGYTEVRHRYLPPEEKFGIILSNRGGRMANAEFAIPTLADPLTSPCLYTSYMFFMNYNGEVLLCPHDWHESGLVGNMKEETFIDIWTGDKFRNYRKKLLNGDRTHLPCSGCDVPGTLMGENHAVLWLEEINESA
jgi:radical SAM protein with 4Fe4S-binding SPASM domain